MKTYPLFIFIACIYTIHPADCEDGTSFNADILSITNNYRKMNGAKALEQDNDLISHAQEWADILCKEDAFKHNQTKDEGENLYKYWVKPKPKNTPNLAADANRWWYSECQCQKNENKFNPDTGHFTQLVWKLTTKLGCGWCTYTSNSWSIYVMVCRYKPPGNYDGQYTSNVGTASNGYCGNTTLNKVECKNT